MRKFLAILCAALLVSALAFAAAAPSRKQSAAKKSATAKKRASKKSSSSKKRRPAGKSAQTWRNRQLQPAPDRYRDIQEALVRKGYLQGRPTGAWDSSSAEALRRFQQDQKIEPTGKIDSLSLIALGLGPKYDTAAAVASPRARQP